MKRAGNVFLPPPRVTLCTFQLHMFADSSDSELQLDLIGPTSPSRDAALIKIKWVPACRCSSVWSDNWNKWKVKCTREEAFLLFSESAGLWRQTLPGICFPECWPNNGSLIPNSELAARSGRTARRYLPPGALGEISPPQLLFVSL